MEQNTDILFELELKKKRNVLFLITASVYLLLIVFSGAYLIWLFIDALPNPFEDDEFIVLFLFQLIFPAIGALFFLMRKQIGWYLLMFFSLVNVIYIFDYIFEGLRLDQSDLFSIGHFLLLFLMFTRSVTGLFSITRNSSSKFTFISVLVLILFYYFLY